MFGLAWFLVWAGPGINFMVLVGLLIGLADVFALDVHFYHCRLASWLGRFYFLCVCVCILVQVGCSYMGLV